MHGRDGLSRLLHDAREGRFSVLVVEALDRLSRDQEDLAHLHKRLSFLGIEIVAVHDGRADAIQVGIRGLVSTLFIADLKHKVRRGMGAVVKDGRHPGGRAYGYRPALGRPGILEIFEPEAEVVRRVFSEYLDGHSPRDIAGRLNAEAIPAPRGARWNASTINGSRQRSHGILSNPIYGGTIIWNRVRMIRDPDTGKRISRPNPPEEWVRAPAPELAIVTPETFEAAQAAKDAAGHAQRHRPARRRKGILSGLLRCSRCGGGMSKHDTDKGRPRIRCSTSKESGACDNGRRYYLDSIERAVIEGVRARIENPGEIAAHLWSYQQAERDDARRRAKAEKKLAAAKAKLDRLSVLLLDQKVSDDFFDQQAPALRAEVAEAEKDLQAAPPKKVIALHPGAIEAYRRGMAQLAATMGDLDPREDRELIEAFRDLIDRVVIHDDADGGVHCEVIGLLGPLVGEENDRAGVSVVAEGRLQRLPPLTWGTFAA